MAFLSPSSAVRDDLSRLLASPAQFLPSPLGGAHGLFASPAVPSKAGFAVQEGRLSFDVLLQEHDGQERPRGPCALEGMRCEDAPSSKAAARSVSHLELFALPAGAERSKSADLAAAVAAEQATLEAALTERVVAKVVAASQQEAHDLVAGVAAKYGLVGDYGRAEETIKAVWGQRPNASRANSAADGLAGAAAKHPASQHQQQQTGGADELTLGKGSSDHASGDEEAGQQATSTLKPLAPTSRTDGEAGARIGSKRALVSQPSFSFRGPSQCGAAADAADAAALKKRRVHYDRMRELEAEVQRVRHLGDALKQSLHQAEAQHDAATMENEQLWNALLHIHASLRAAHAAHLRQQVAMHAAAVAAVLPPASVEAPGMEAPSPTSLFGGLFSPDADELAAACGMFISPAKAAHTSGAANKPRKLFLDESGVRPTDDRTSGQGDLHAQLSPAMWIPAA